MKRIVLSFGLISGLFSVLMMFSTMALEKRIGIDKAEYLGYTLIVLSFLLVFFGIRSYREKHAQGQISFLRGFSVGIGITLITCVFYVAAWEIMYYNFMPDFADKYAEHMVAKARASGASQAAIEAQIEEMNKFRQAYRNPVYNSAMTFLEPFPIGLAITILSAAVLRRRPRPQPNPAAMAAAE